MSDLEETYCRLCAEPTPLDQLISADEDVAVNSKIINKMKWINIEISTVSDLPTSICFACFDSLERTWSFLHNVRTAQEKLKSIYKKKVSGKIRGSSGGNKLEKVLNAGKPVNIDWQEFQKAKSEVTDIKIDPDTTVELATVDPNSLLELGIPIKTEEDSENDYRANDTDGFNSTDSDIPLRCTVKKRKTKRKKKAKFDMEITAEDLLKSEVDAEPLNISSLNITWDDYMCRCADCDALCKNISSLRLHSLQIHSRCCVFKCSDCGKVIANFKSFVTHVRSHKNMLRYCCEYCNKQFTLTAYVKKHLNTFHDNACLSTCQNCGAYFDSEELLQDHTILYSKGSKKSRKTEKFEFDLKCEDCGKEFKSRSNLQQHKLVHTERSRDFSCHVCGKMFFTKGTLSTHMSTHEDAKPFKCEYCPMAFRARGNLQSHISLHSGAKPFVCEQCGKSFRVKRHLKSHSIVHTDLMPYVCQYCNKSFRFKTRLNLHLRQHTGAKPYNCVYCQRDFTNGSNFKKHMKRRHNVDTSRKRYNNVIADGTNDLNNDGQTDSV